MVYGQMQLWLALVGLTYVALYLIQRFTGTLYEANSFIFGSFEWLWLAGVVTGFAIMLFARAQPKRPWLRAIKLFVLIAFSILLLALAVLLTGGFIDSPFSAAVSLYLGFFIALIHARTHQPSSWVFVSLTVICIVSPYVYLYCQNHASLQILRWHTSAPTTAVRLMITISLLLITGWVGGKVSSELKLFSPSDVTTTRS
jgi:hypothetical protein